jgi:hypothetical protein
MACSNVASIQLEFGTLSTLCSPPSVAGPFSALYSFCIAIFSRRISLDFLTPKPSWKRVKASSIDRPSVKLRCQYQYIGTPSGPRLTGLRIAEVSKNKTDHDKAQVKTVRPTGGQSFEPTSQVSRMRHREDARERIRTRSGRSRKQSD